MPMNSEPPVLLELRSGRRHRLGSFLARYASEPGKDLLDWSDFAGMDMLAQQLHLAAALVQEREEREVRRLVR